MTSRERIHHAVNTTDMGWSNLRMKDIDILTAMGMTDRQGDFVQLGGVLIVIKTATRSRSLMYIPGNDLYRAAEKEACEKLSEVARHHRDIKTVRRDQRDYLAAMTITEWINDSCPECNGAGQIKRDDGGVIISCPACAGSGKRRFTDDERIETLHHGNPDVKMKDLQARYESMFERTMMLMHGMIGLAEAAKMRATADMLERY